MPPQTRDNPLVLFGVAEGGGLDSPYLSSSSCWHWPRQRTRKEQCLEPHDKLLVRTISSCFLFYRIPGFLLANLKWVLWHLVQDLQIKRSRYEEAGQPQSHKWLVTRNNLWSFFLKVFLKQFSIFFQKKKKDKRQNKTQKTKRAWTPELQFLTKKALGNFWLKKTFLAFVVCLLNFQICCYCLRKSVTVDLEPLLSPIWLPNHGMISTCYHARLQLFFSWLRPKIKTISSKLKENWFFVFSLSGAQLLGANFNTWLMNKNCSFQNLRRHW